MVPETCPLREEREAHDVGHGSEGATNLDLLWSQVLLNIKVLDAIEQGVNSGLLLTWSDSHLLIAIGAVINLDNLSDEGAARIGRINTRIESVVTVVVILPGAIVAHARDVPASSCCRVEHFFIL